MQTEPGFECRAARRGVGWLALLLSVLPLAGFCAGETQVQGVQTLRDEMRAAVQRKDKDALLNLLGPDFVYVHSTGKTDDRSARVDALMSGNAMETQAPDQLAIQALDERTAVACGQTRIPSRSGEPFLLHWNAVYLLIRSQWRAVYVQSWRVPTAP